MLTSSCVGSLTAAPTRRVAHAISPLRHSPKAHTTLARYKITLRRPSGEESVIECDKDTFILDASEAKDQKVVPDLPSACRGGTCCTCAGKVLSGTVDQADQQFLDDAQLEKGFALLCVSYPTSDLVILTDQEDNLN